MFERYTERARRTLFFARYEASQRGSVSIEPGHLFLGLLREAGPLGSVLARANIAVDDLRADMPHAVVSTPLQTEIPFTSVTKQVLARAVVEAQALGDQHIGPEHLLLALVGDGSSQIAAALVGRGLTYDRAKEHIVALGPQLHDLDTRAATSITKRVRAPDGRKPDLAPSYDVHIAPTVEGPGRRSTRGPGYWAVYGFTLAGVLAHLFDIDESRVECATTVQRDARFDIVAVLPQQESPETLARFVQQAVERHFGLTLALELRTIDVYVVAADPDKSGAAAIRPAGGFFGSFGLPVGVDPDFSEVSTVSRQMGEIVKAAATLPRSTGALACVGRTRELPADVLLQLQERFGVSIVPDRRPMLLLVGKGEAAQSSR
jgi:hypothetical protein